MRRKILIPVEQTNSYRWTLSNTDSWSIWYDEDFELLGFMAINDDEVKISEKVVRLKNTINDRKEVVDYIVSVFGEDWNLETPPEFLLGQLGTDFENFQFSWNMDKLNADGIILEKGFDGGSNFFDLFELPSTILMDAEYTKIYDSEPSLKGWNPFDTYEDQFRALNKDFRSKVMSKLSASMGFTDWLVKAEYTVQVKEFYYQITMQLKKD